MSRQITVKRYQRRFRQPLRTSRGEWSLREGFLLRVESAAGVGYGEVAPIPEFGSETVEAAAAFLETLAREPETAVPGDLPCCAFALSAAGRDACPQGSAQDARSYPVSALLPAGSTALRIAEAKLTLGYTNLKCKIGVEPLAEELAQARSLLESLPEGAMLRLDANAGLAPAELEAWLELLGQFPRQVDYLEQPLACGQEALMAEAAQRSGVPIALDESLNGAGGAGWLEPGAWDGPLVIKAPLMGEVAALRCRLEPLAGQVVLSSVFETGIGLANVLALADALPGLTRPIGFDTLDAFDDALSPAPAGSNICAIERVGYNPEIIWTAL